MTPIERLRAALAESDLSEPMKDDAARLLALYDAARAYRVWRDGSGQDQKGGWELWQALCDAIAACEGPA